MIDGRRGRDASADGADHELPEDVAEESLATLDEVVTDPEEPDVAASAAEGGDRPNVFVRGLKALGPKLVSLGVKADHVTVIGLLLACVTGVMIAYGQFYLAVILGTSGCLMDTLDGAVAKAAGTSSKRGAFFDSVSDRVAEMFIFGGMAWYFAGGSGHNPRLALIPLAILGVSNTISYERAKAESLGYEAKGGLMERAERLISVGVILLLNEFFHVSLFVLLLVLLGLCVLTALQRFARVWVQASDPAHAANAESSQTLAAFAARAGTSAMLGRRPARVESRWRAWRESSTESSRTRVATASRARSRRRPEPLSTRLRQAFLSERGAQRATTRTVARTGRARSERRLRDAEVSFRRRLGSGR